jgi:hypothetical protein
MLSAAPLPDLVAAPEALAYRHARSMVLPREMTPVEVWTLMMAKPLPLIGLAFRLRDAISARFGVKRIGGFSGRAPRDPRVGERLDFFLVERNDPAALTLTERDRHLDVMISVTTGGRLLTVTASVLVHNWFGRLYMLPVGPAHRLIVWAMMRRLERALRG